MLDADADIRAPARGRYDRESTVSERVIKQRRLILQTLRTTLVLSLPQSITVTELSKKTGLGRNTLYSHFPSIKAGCESVIATCWEELRSELAERPLKSATPLALCGELSERWFQCVLANPKAARVVINCDGQELSGLLLDELTALWDVGAKAGAFAPEPDPLRLRALSAALLELVKEVARGANADHCTAVMTDLLSRGLR